MTRKWGSFSKLFRPLRGGNPLWAGEFAPGCPYVERAEQRDAWHDRVAKEVWANSRWAIGKARDFVFKSDVGIVAEVAKHAAFVGGLSDDEITLYAKGMRRALRRSGYELAPVGFCFALVSEAAYRTLGIRHYETQLICGWELLHGRLVEMETGEGKTLAATLSAATVALSGYPVHVVTVNNYLAERDAALLEPVYRLLGLSTDAALEGTSIDSRRAAYSRSITYCTNKQLVFDYLHDRSMAKTRTGSMNAGRSPLPVRKPDAARHLLRGLYYVIVDEADSVFIDEAQTPLVLSSSMENENDDEFYRKALNVASSLRPEIDFALDIRRGSASLLPEGRRGIEAMTWLGYSNIARTDIIQQSLIALHVFKRDKHYIIVDDSIQIVDEPTGRVMADRSWSRDLHRFVEVKEGCPQTPQRGTLARITYQSFFRRYLRLCGMTGTAMEVAREVRQVYGLEVRRVAPRHPTRRLFFPAHLSSNQMAKWGNVAAVVKQIVESERRPVLIGTRSVAASEQISGILNEWGISHALLNARHPEAEAAIVARAGQSCAVTVATNMAGRGTDIKLAPSVETAGGLHVILTEYHASRRVDRQLFGRCARDGKPGSCQVLVALDDETFLTTKWTKFLIAKRMKSGRPAHPMLLMLLRRLAQRDAELQAKRARMANLALGLELDRALAFSGRSE